jgi:hypothetical protein
MDKLEAWILQQQEAVLIWGQPRTTRKRAAEAIADIMTRIPTRDPENVEMNRADRRRLMEALRKQNKDWWKDISV